MGCGRGGGDVPKIVDSIERQGINMVFVIGGNGSHAGANAISAECASRGLKVSVVGIPKTIDNDILHIDKTFGFDTAVERGVEAIDRVRDTAESHRRVFLVEVMGRHSGAIAIAVGVAGGAEGIVIPERETNIVGLAEHLQREQQCHASSVVVVAEGDGQGAVALSDALRRQMPDVDMRVTVLGHVQRGGAPTARDRLLATGLGADAIRGLLAGESGFMSGVWRGEVRRVPMSEVAPGNHEPARRLERLADQLAFLT